jgi:hypothetical protein
MTNAESKNIPNYNHADKGAIDERQLSARFTN